jgi:hypothetical protein
MRKKCDARGMAGRCRKRGRWEIDCCKFDSNHTCSLTFVEELSSLVTLHTSPCDNDRTTDMKKTMNRNYFWRFTTGKLEFWWYPCFHWRFQWTEDIMDTSSDQGFYTYHHLPSLLHGSDPAVGGQD